MTVGALTPAGPLKLTRLACGLRQTDLATLAGVHVDTAVSRLENGELPTLATARALAHALKATVDELFPTNSKAPGSGPRPRTNIGEPAADNASET